MVPTQKERDKEREERGRNDRVRNKRQKGQLPKARKDRKVNPWRVDRMRGVMEESGGRAYF